METDFDIMCSDMTRSGIITFDRGIRPNGRPIYRVTWWDGGKWDCAYYRTFDAGYETYKMIRRMI